MANVRQDFVRIADLGGVGIILELRVSMQLSIFGKVAEYVDTIMIHPLLLLSRPRCSPASPLAFAPLGPIDIYHMMVL